ncbi:10618_t:CDS:2, partial [Funneliformis geosporum]
NTASDDSSTLSRLDGFEKQLEKREVLLKQKENNIKKIIEDRKSGSNNLKKQYKSRISTLEKSIVVKDKEICKLSASIFQLKHDKNALKKNLASTKKTIKVLDDIIYSKDQTIITYNEGLQKINAS